MTDLFTPQFGEFGGAYVPEALTAALVELDAELPDRRGVGGGRITARAAITSSVGSNAVAITTAPPPSWRPAMRHLRAGS